MKKESTNILENNVLRRDQNTIQTMEFQLRVYEKQILPIEVQEKHKKIELDYYHQEEGQLLFQKTLE